MKEKKKVIDYLLNEGIANKRFRDKKFGEYKVIDYDLNPTALDHGNINYIGTEVMYKNKNVPNHNGRSKIDLLSHLKDEEI